MWTVLCLLPIYLAVLCGARGPPSLDQGRITVNMIAGFTAVLPCTVKNKDDRTRVMWFGPSNNLLTMNEHKRTSDDRISLRRPYENDWNLRIEQVKYSDRGEYRCQLATVPIQTKVAHLNVKLSPKILTEYSSKEVVAREGSDVELICNATGVPHPDITWFRKHKDTPNEKESLGTGLRDQLLLSNITREEAGTYECVAQNGVAPADSIAIKVDVQFAPEINIGVDTLSQMVGKNTVLECEITGFPLEVAVWRYNEVDIEERTWKYEPFVFRRDERTILLSLEIRGLSASDFGVYTCFASNVIGSANKTKILEEFKVTTPLALRPKPTTANPATTTSGSRGTTLITNPVLSTSPDTSVSTTTIDNVIISDKNPSDRPAYTLHPPDKEGSSGSTGQTGSCPTFGYQGWTLVFVVITTCLTLVS